MPKRLLRLSKSFQSSNRLSLVRAHGPRATLFYRAIAGLFVLSLAFYPMPELRISVAGATVPYYVPFIAVLALLWPLQLVRAEKVALPGGYLMSLMMLVITILFTALLAPLVNLNFLVRYVMFALTPVFLAQAASTRPTVTRLAALLVAACAAATFFGFYRFFAGEGGLPAEHALGYWGIRYLPASRNSDVLYPLAGFLLVLGYALSLRRRAGWLETAPILLLLGLFGAAVLASQVRSAWLAIVVGTGIAYGSGGPRAFSPRAVAVLLGSGVMVALLAFLFLSDAGIESLAARAASWSLDDPTISNRERIDVTLYSLGLALTHPLGVGPGNIFHFFDGVGTRWAENAYLNVAVELGFLGALAFGFFALAPIMPLKRIAAINLGDWQPRAMAALAGALAAFLFFNVETVGMFYWVLASVIVATLAVWAKRPSARTAFGSVESSHTRLTTAEGPSS